MSADARVPNRIDAYAKFWQKDSAADSQTDTDNRLDNYKEVVNGPCPHVLPCFSRCASPDCLPSFHAPFRCESGSFATHGTDAR